MKLTSEAFQEGHRIPDQYSRYGTNHVPPLHFEDVPERAKSLAVMVDDPDAPSGMFHHWVLFNMDPKIRDIKEDRVPVMAMQGRNDFGAIEYDGPEPPSGEHRYYFKAFALDTMLPLGRGCKPQDVEREMAGHVLDSATLMGRFAH